MLNEIDLSRADLNLLVLFEAVLQERHVGRAADRLSLSPSAVSHGLGRLRRLLNDPLFVRTPKGVVPTERATALSAPDGVSAVFLPALLAELDKRAPGIDIGLRQLLPLPGETSLERAWRGAFADLEARAIDIAIIPSSGIPARFYRRTLYEEEFVLAVRAGHPFLEAPTLDRYCAMRHLVVSLNGDPYGFVDEVLARQGRTRRVGLTVPNFMFALAVLAETDLIAALPRRFALSHAGRFGVVSVDAPLPLGSFRLNAVSPSAAMSDVGLAWLLSVLHDAERIDLGEG